MTPLILSLIAALLYAGAAWRAARSPQADPLWQRALLPVALALHALALLEQTLFGDHMLIGVGEVASLLAWLSALMLWVFCLREPLQALGVVTYPFAAACSLLPLLPGREGNPIPLDDWRLGVHIILSLLSAGLLTLAAIHALAIAILDRILHRPDNIALARRLPPLQTMEKLLFQLIFVGFFLLSLTLCSGLLIIPDLHGEHLAQLILTASAWVIFSVLLWGRLRYGWRGRTAIRWALSGYATLVAAYFGSKLVLEQIFNIHWS
ncbi:MAG TPA: cytochrome c biogenesis protein CcsA [Nevskia sp.]|nr:cytochrome c biogenesis protein CcsA [Nevskia sp.]